MSVKYRIAIRDAMAEAMSEDPDVVVLGQDVGASDGLFRLTEGLHGTFGDGRVIDTPISETATVGMAIGLAMQGFRPVVEVAFSDHLAVCFDAVVNQIAKVRQLWPTQIAELPIVIRTLTGAGMGGGPQHSQSLEALFAHVPGLEVMCPATPSDAKHLLRRAIASPHPVVFLEHKALLRSRGDIQTTLADPGRATVRRTGGDVTIVTYSASLRAVLDAADELGSEDVSAEVVDLRTIVPLDVATVVRSVSRTGRLLVVHEGHEFLGVGAEICAQVAEQLPSLGVRMRRLTPPRVAVPVDRDLEAVYMPSAGDVVEAVRELMGDRLEQPSGGACA